MIRPTTPRVALRPAITLIALLVTVAFRADAFAQTPDFPIPMHRGNGLANFFAKLNAAQSVTVAYIGGSVTQGWGWRDLTTQWLNSLYPGKITEINAGWGGTGSLIGTMRYQRDVLAHDPDLVFVEFAVNDLPEDPIYFIRRNCEGFPLQAWTQDPTIDICFIETIAWYLEGAYLSGNLPNTVQAHYDVCDHYAMPSVNVGWALYEHVPGGTSWESLTLDGDRVHPNQAGSQIYADAVTAYLNSERTRAGASDDHAIPSPLTDYPVTSGTIHDLTAAPTPPGWTLLQNQFGVPQIIQSSTPGATVTTTFDGPAAALKLVVGPDDGGLSASIDGGPYTALGLADVGFHWVWALPVAKTLSFGSHTITIRVDSGTARLINVESANSEPAGPGPDDINLALTAIADAADTEYSASFNATKARDGLTSTKWTSTNTASTHWLAYDLGPGAQISTVIVKHASSGGETTLFNTEAFTIQTGDSLAGPWTTAFVGSNPGQLGTSIFSFVPPVYERYVRLYITDAGIDNYARIPEFEVWGVRLAPLGDMDGDGDLDQEDSGLFQRCLSGGGKPQTDPECALALLDDDDDVDNTDYAIFINCMTAPNIPANPDCGR